MLTTDKKERFLKVPLLRNVILTAEVLKPEILGIYHHIKFGQNLKLQLTTSTYILKHFILGLGNLLQVHISWAILE